MITLGIIGVVATLTLPNVMSNYKNKVYVAQLQKVYNQMSNAAAQYMVDEDVDNLEDSYLPNNEGRFLRKYFRVVKDCGTLDDSCFASNYKSLDKSETGDASAGYCVSINTGSSICMYHAVTDARAKVMSGDDAHGFFQVYVDVNGKSGPNIAGRDLFAFELYSDGKIDESYNNDQSWRCFDLEDVFVYGAGCFSKIISDGWKMDY